MIRLSSQGSILIRVFTSDAYLPLAGAPVIVTQTRSDGSLNLLAIRITDSSGITQPVIVSTPEEALSLQPDPGSNPYALVDIRASYPGYSSFHGSNIPVFTGVETIQEVQLKPQSEPGTGGYDG